MKSLKILIAICAVFAFSEAQAQYVAVYKSYKSLAALAFFLPLIY